MTSVDARDWIALGPHHYRLSHLYTSDNRDFASLTLDSHVTASARDGGPIALVPNHGWGIETPLKVFTASGRQLCGSNARKIGRRGFPGAKVVALGWIDEVHGDDTLTEEGVACIHEDGAVRIWNAKGFLKREMRIDLSSTHGEGGKRSRVSLGMNQGRENACTFCSVQTAEVLSGGSIITLTSDGRLLFTSLQGVTEILHTVPSTVVSSSGNPAHSLRTEVKAKALKLICLDPKVHKVSTPESLICQGYKRNIVLVNSRQVVSYSQTEEFTLAELSPCGGKLALYEPLSNRIQVLSSRNCALLFSLAIPGHGTHNRGEPQSISWIGSECVAAAYPPSLVLLDVTGDGLTGCFTNVLSPDNDSTLLAADADALRVTTRGDVYLIDRVSPPLFEVVEKKKSPAYQLYKSTLMTEAAGQRSESVALKKYRAIHSLFSDGARLYRAAESCVQAALSSLSVKQQKLLLRAAMHGFGLNRVLSSSVRDDGGAVLALAAARLRLENTIREEKCGIALTHEGVRRVGNTRLAIRLSSLGAHTVALSFIEATGAEARDAAFSSAMDVIRSSQAQPEDVMSRLEGIHSNFRPTTSFFGRIARVVTMMDSLMLGTQKSELIASLLRKESSPGERVDSLIFLGQYTYGLMDAYQDGDPEKIHFVSEHLVEQGRFLRVVRSLPKIIGARVVDIRAAYLKGCKKYAELRKLYIDVGRWREAAGIDIIMACESLSHKERLRNLESTKLAWHNRLQRHHVFEYSAIRSAVAVVHAAEDLERQQNLTPSVLQDKTANELLTFASGVEEAKERRGILRRMRYEMKIPDRRYCWVVLKALAGRKDSEGIRQMASGADNYGRMPIVGLSAFVQVCLEEGMLNEAAYYAKGIPDLRDRARALAKCGRSREAAEVAARLNSEGLMEEVATIAARSAPALSVSTA